MAGCVVWFGLSPWNWSEQSSLESTLHSLDVALVESKSVESVIEPSLISLEHELVLKTESINQLRKEVICRDVKIGRMDQQLHDCTRMIDALKETVATLTHRIHIKCINEKSTKIPSDILSDTRVINNHGSNHVRKIKRSIRYHSPNLLSDETEPLIELPTGIVQMKPSRRKFIRYECQLCKIQCIDKRDVHSHCLLRSHVKHLNKMSQMEGKTKSDAKAISSSFWCKYCDKDLFHSSNWISHIHGKSHQRNKNAYLIKKVASQKKSQDLRGMKEDSNNNNQIALAVCIIKIRDECDSESLEGRKGESMRKICSGIRWTVYRSDSNRKTDLLVILFSSFTNCLLGMEKIQDDLTDSEYKNIELKYDEIELMDWFEHCHWWCLFHRPNTTMITTK